MDAARVWVRSIAVLVMVAAFLDFLMPQGSLRRFARVVMGLFVLLAILQPVVTLLHQELAVTRALLSAGDQLPVTGKSGAGSDQTIALTEKALERQVEGIVASITGVPGATAEVRLSPGEGSLPGGVGHVRIVLPTQAGGKSDGSAGGSSGSGGVPQVTIALPAIVPGPTQPPSSTARKDRQAEVNRIKEVISGLYVVPPDSIEVVTP